MDLMDYRRKLFMIGGKNVVGDFSKYQRFTITPSVADEISFTHSLGIVPKLVIVDGNVVTSGDFTNHFICDNTLGVGIATSGLSAIWEVRIGTISHIGGLVAFLTDSEVVVRRQSSNRKYDTNTAYNVEIYA